MRRIFGLASVMVLVAMVLATGCKPHSASKAAPGTPTPSAYFQTPFQDESQYIVEAVVSDVAEQMYYAAYHRLPDPNYFQVVAMEKPGSPQDAPVYELDIRVDPKMGETKSEANINGPIWSPAVYQGVAEQLGGAMGLKVANTGAWRDTSLLSKLTDGSAETIEEENEQLSASLEQNFADPQSHEQSAALLGAFLLRDHSGYFYDIRSPLSRMTAHLIIRHQWANGRSDAPDVDQ